MVLLVVHLEQLIKCRVVNDAIFIIVCLCLCLCLVSSVRCLCLVRALDVVTASPVVFCFGLKLEEAGGIKENDRLVRYYRFLLTPASAGKSKREEAQEGSPTGATSRCICLEGFFF